MGKSRRRENPEVYACGYNAGYLRGKANSRLEDRTEAYAEGYASARADFLRRRNDFYAREFSERAYEKWRAAFYGAEAAGG